MEAITEFGTKVAAWVKKARTECTRFTILIIGDTGVGKSTLINNLLWKDVAKEGNTVESETATIARYEGEVKSVPVVFYDTPGLGDSRSTKDQEYLQQIQTLMKKEDIALVI